MKKIKTIYHKNVDDFDVEVNNELENGWTLAWQSAQVYNGEVHLFARLEKEEPHCHTCMNCRYCDKEMGDDPCCDCEEGENDKWEARE